jgi:ribosomal protein L11 methyltransferase
VSAPLDEAEQLRARFLELAPEGFEEEERGDEVELTAYGEAAARVLAVFPSARATELEDGWEDRWRAFHRPVRVGALWVGPPWETAPRDAIPIVVDPGRAFGTGAHATTRLCLALLLDEDPGAVLDIGCGSGVLAIAAAKLGHTPVIAVDVDDAAVEATRTNARRNDVAIDVRRVDALADRLPAADVALANIALDAVEALGARLDVGRVVTSGYLVSDEPSLDGFRRLARRRLDGWAADLHERR